MTKLLVWRKLYKYRKRLDFIELAQVNRKMKAEKEKHKKVSSKPYFEEELIQNSVNNTRKNCSISKTLASKLEIGEQK